MEIFISTAQSKVEEIPAKRYTPDEAFALPDFSVGSAEKAYKLPAKQGYVVIDNKKGLGQTPDNQNVLYKGFIALMTPEALVDVMPDMRKRENASHEIIDIIKQGYSIGNPCLYLNIDPYIEKEEGIPKFTGHEGRARIWALRKMGVKEIPIQVFFLGYRARHIENQQEFLHWLNQGVRLERSHRVLPKLFKDIIFG